MKSFFLDRGHSLGIIVLILLAVSVAQAGISYTLSYGTLLSLLEHLMSPLLSTEVVFRYGAPALALLRFVSFVIALLLYLLRRKTTLFRLVIATNVLFTVTLLGQTSGLINELFGGQLDHTESLMRNVVLMLGSNILVFSLWYWIIDPPGVEGKRRDEPWEFLFPQRAGPLPHYETWQPHYFDYLFLAFMTSFAFSPTDTAPLTTRAKMLMLLQSSISVITLVVIASGSINILAGAK